MGKALVLGGKTGLLGQALAQALDASGWETTRAGREDVDFCASDGADALERLVDSCEPDIICNCVAYTRVDDAEENEDAAALLNRALPAVLGRIVQSRPCAVLHYSTDFVFNGKKKTPYTTEDATDPLCVYGKTKLAGEEALLSQAADKSLIVRTAWLFGPGGKNFVSTILGLCANRPSLNVVHDQIGSPTYTPDLAQYSVKLVESGARGFFHIVNSGQASWCELAGEAARFAQSECAIHPIPSSEYPQKAQRPAYSVLDSSAFTNATGITPRAWVTALRDYIFTTYPAP